MRRPFFSFVMMTGIMLSHSSYADSFHTSNAVSPPQFSQETRKDWDVKLGAGALFQPEYEGSDEYEFLALPYISVDYKDIVTFNPFGGLRYNAIKRENLTLGVGLGADFGRDEDDNSDLNGLGDVDATIEGQLFAKYSMGATLAEVHFSQDLGDGHEGYEIEAEVGRRVAITDNLIAVPSVSTTYSGENYLDSYFGVNAIQSARSGLRRFDPDAGFKDVSANLFVNYKIDENWSVNNFARLSTLTGDAQDSPITRDDTQFNAGAFLVYSFH